MPLWLIIVILIVAVLVFGAGFLFDLIGVLIPIAVVLGLAAIIMFFYRSLKNKR